MLIMGLAVALGTASTWTPNGPWTLEAETDYCAIRRSFHSSDGTATLAFKPDLNGVGMQMIILSTDAKGQRMAGRASVTPSATGQAIDAPYTSAVIEQRATRLTTIALDHDILPELHDGDSLSVIAAPFEASFAIANAGKVTAAVQGCMASLFKSWGLDWAAVPAHPPALAGNPGSFFGYDDYPAEAVRNHVQGRVVLALSIDPTGAVTQCKPVVSADKLLDDGSCRTAMKVRFHPARDKNDSPIASVYLLPVRWVLPGG